VSSSSGNTSLGRVRTGGVICGNGGIKSFFSLTFLHVDVSGRGRVGAATTVSREGSCRMVHTSKALTSNRMIEECCM